MRGGTDYDLAVFASYANYLKQALQFTFQSILYRLFRESKCTDMTANTFIQVRDRLAFTKGSDTMMRGVLMSRFLEAQPNSPDWH